MNFNILTIWYENLLTRFRGTEPIDWELREILSKEIAMFHRESSKRKVIDPAHCLPGDIRDTIVETMAAGSYQLLINTLRHTTKIDSKTDALVKEYYFLAHFNKQFQGGHPVSSVMIREDLTAYGLRMEVIKNIFIRVKINWDVSALYLGHHPEQMQLISIGKHFQLPTREAIAIIEEQIRRGVSEDLTNSIQNASYVDKQGRLFKSGIHRSSSID